MSGGGPEVGGTEAAYRERLYVPLRWWVQGTMFLATLWIAFIVSLPHWVAWTATGVAFALTYAWFLLVGAARIEIVGGQLQAGDARIPLDLLGTPEPLDADDTRRVMGVDAHARAFLLTRPYLKRSVRVPVHDPDDPTPYWLLSTRRPATLARALQESGSSRLG